MDDSQAFGSDANNTSGVSIHAGFPNPGADKRLKGLDLNQLLVRHPTSTFMFRIRGDQGAPVGIFDGDIAVVDRMARHAADSYVLWHDGQRFNLSRATRMTEGGIIWGTITSVIHQYNQA